TGARTSLVRYPRPMRYLIALLLLGSGLAHADAGTDFATEAREMFRLAACGGDDAIPEKFPKKTIDAHCKEMADIYASYKKAWATPAEKFIADLRPSNLPSTVVYPFGGGDLSSA